MKITQRVKEILSNYSSENPGTLTNLARLLGHGTLGGTGRLVILPVDQGFEHGPFRSFGPNPDAMDPEFHVQLAIDSGCSAYAAPLGFIEAVAQKYAGQVPLLLKLNNSDTLSKIEPCSAITGSVKDALRLGCIGVGFTIYPGSSARNTMYEQLRHITEEAKAHGLLVVVWSYPRGTNLSKEGEVALDVVSYGAHLAAQLGAHIIKVKLPKDHIELPEAKKVYDQYRPSTKTLADRVKHIVNCCFHGKRIVIFSGGEAKDEQSVLDDAKAILAGGGFGSIIGRNAFQRPKLEALSLLRKIMEIYA